MTHVSAGEAKAADSLIQEGGGLDIIHCMIIHNFGAVRKRQEVRIKSGIMKSNISSKLAVLLQFDVEATIACGPISESQLDFS